MDTIVCLLVCLLAFLFVLLALELSRVLFMLLALKPSLLLAASAMLLLFSVAQFQVTSAEAEYLDFKEFTLADTWPEFF
jgi:hypothetical protein